MEITLANGIVTYEPSDDQLGGVSLELAAMDGEVGIGQIPIPDPSAAVNLFSGRSAQVDEIATVLLDGFIIDQDRQRGASERTGNARVHTMSVMDANARLDGFRVRRTRSAETDYDRVIEFADRDLPSTVLTTWVLNSNTVTMAAKKYESVGWPAEFIPDLVEWTGKTLFLHSTATGVLCLHYHLLTQGHTCGLTISDQVPQAGTSYRPGQPVRMRTSVDLINDLVGLDQSGRSYRTTDPSSIANHDPDGLLHEGLETFEANNAADLAVKTKALLASNKEEVITYQVDIGPLDASALALIRPGDLMTVTSTILGLVADVQRIAHMTLTVWTGDGGVPAPGLWNAHLELGAPIRRRRRIKGLKKVTAPVPIIPGSGGTEDCGITDEFNRDEASSWGMASYGQTWTVDSTGTDRTVNLSVVEADLEAEYELTTVGTASETGPVLTLPYVPIHENPTYIYFEARMVVTGTGSRNMTHIVRVNQEGDLVQFVDASVAGDGFKVVRIDTVAGGVVNFFSNETIAQWTTGYAFRLIVDREEFWAKVWRLGSTEPTDYTEVPRSIPLSGTTTDEIETFCQNSFLNAGPTALGYSFFLANLDVTDVAFCSDISPGPGDPVGPELVGTGDTFLTAFNTIYPYQLGTTKVYLDGTRQFTTDDYTESDPTIGEITFVTPPGAGVKIRVEYQAA